MGRCEQQSILRYQELLKVKIYTNCSELLKLLQTECYALPLSVSLFLVGAKLSMDRAGSAKSLVATNF